MRVVKTIAGLEAFLENLGTASWPTSATVGFVPTMGALHAGHLALIRQARQDCEIVIVSIFVNPLQFGPQEDLARYPQTLAQDCDLCQTAAVDLVFAPHRDALYPQANLTRVIPPPELTEALCGRSRPGHFTGVATVVLKLLNLVKPQRAYFGQKDAQQLAIIRRLVADLNLPVKIIAIPIIRESAGLAWSSRNQYLTELEREQATAISQALQQAQTLFHQGIRDRAALIATVQKHLAQVPTLTLDYIDLVDPDTMQPLGEIKTQGLLATAVYLGTTRLIDNCLLDACPPILAIDGPAGAGKSTVTRQAAAALGLLYLDTGAMYRAATWWLMTAQVNLGDPIAVADTISQCRIEFVPQSQPGLAPKVFINGQDVSQAIRAPEVTAHVSQVAAQPAVRKILVKQQQLLGQNGGVAAEGRDIGTHVFPQAGLKIFLTASVEERAKRRWQELQAQGNPDISLAQLQADISQRDYADQHRAYAPFRPAPDAIEIVTDQLSIEAVTAEIIRLYQVRFSLA
ncbi:bifunctional pantoate--beta-alanine ligase/(d)CMP kinase [Synechococcus sp. PCC 6312]|uniref:bifunctional pantoate--beta-alanine ligase/(d)CMP kinase n=1 Tax=Synechococcus sp. (strain ATCC 27167 / PCC 6312) TaxID=195253 RepID=UPI00029ED3C8|nr:bifunctional pantoate--beta-alanine ligase/(d)CMP kinase [Synechococcus sp. PCC 6312]AFY60794.1 cytidylate kinase/pantoate--beta-alanine ligase [Synechococcus sp. PCC 6312]